MSLVQFLVAIPRSTPSRVPNPFLLPAQARNTPASKRNCYCFCAMSAPLYSLLLRRARPGDLPTLPRLPCRRRPPPSALSTAPASAAAPVPIPAVEVQLPPRPSQALLAASLRPHHAASSPAVLRGALSHTDACHCWTSLRYLRLAAGGDDLPCTVELTRRRRRRESGKGGGGGEASFGSVRRAEVAFGDYLSYLEMAEERRLGGGDHIGEDEELAYLAQNDVPPALLSDLEVPEFCDDSSYGLGEGRRYSTMLWLGPEGTVSPLHHDPMDNLLMQIVGRKRVLLYPRTAGSARGGGHRRLLGGIGRTPDTMGRRKMPARSMWRIRRRGQGGTPDSPRGVLGPWRPCWSQGTSCTSRRGGGTTSGPCPCRSA